MRDGPGLAESGFPQVSEPSHLAPWAISWVYNRHLFASYQRRSGVGDSPGRNDRQIHPRKQGQTSKPPPRAVHQVSRKIESSV